jgi:hypothetical protein
MQTEEEFWADFIVAHDNYVAVRAEKGFAFGKYDPAAPLPSWVLRNGERAKPTFVTRPHTGTTPPAKSVEKPAAPPAPIAVAADKPAAGTSFAAQVRAVIAEAKPKGWTQEQVVEHVVTVLNMKRTSAINCVKHNWDRVK